MCTYYTNYGYQRTCSQFTELLKYVRNLKLRAVVINVCGRSGCKNVVKGQ